jgi:sigma-B regulation protein RsbU (phosphoserine phosphatase)
MPDESYEEHTISLAAADRLVLYTDGIVEAFSPEGDLFGVARLDAATARGAAVARGLVDNVLQDMGTFTANGPLTDDQTLLAMVLA